MVHSRSLQLSVCMAPLNNICGQLVQIRHRLVDVSGSLCPRLVCVYVLSC